jgi:hypothetical protein
MCTVSVVFTLFCLTPVCTVKNTGKTNIFLHFHNLSCWLNWFQGTEGEWRAFYKNWRKDDGDETAGHQDHEIIDSKKVKKNSNVL